MIEVEGKYTKAIIHIDKVDDTTMDQIVKMTNNPYFTNTIHIMPDTHAGKGSVIGFTMELTGLNIIPNIIGVDVNCGMIASRLVGLTNAKKNKFKVKNKKFMLKLDTRIRKLIPMGMNIHANNDLDSKILINDILSKIAEESKIEAIQFSHKFYNKFGIKIIDKMPNYTSDEYFKGVLSKTKINVDRFYRSVGTLGGGNHFIELGKDEDGELWLTIHTGSRNFGNLIAKYWQNIAINELKGIDGSIKNEIKKLIIDLKAKGQCNKIGTKITELKAKYNNMEVHDTKLASLSGDNAIGYFFDMIYAGKYAEYNRETICELIMNEFGWNADLVVRSNHNFIDFNDMIIRKGAIAAYKGSLMVIPFNMRDGMLIVEGKSNANWNYSAPHGAGRVLSRSAASNTLDIEQFKNDMVNVFSTSIVKSVLDESPRAYKDAKIIEDAIKPTCSVVYKVKPILNLKDRSEKKDWKKIRNEKKL